MGETMNIEHKDLAAGRWAQMSLCEQLGNIGSEVSRALNWKNKGKAEYSQKAFYRALELLDLTLASNKKLSQLKELARVREVLVDYFYGTNEYSSSELHLRKYFDFFAYAANRQRHLS